MSVSYQTIVNKAKNIKKNVETEYKLGEASTWSYYIAKKVIKRTKTVEKIKIGGASKSTGNDFGRQLTKAQYLDMAKRLVKYVEKHNQLPNNIKIVNKLMRVSDYTYMFARILVYYDTHKKMPNYANVNSKAFIKPTETGNKVYDYFVKVTGKKYKYLDDFLEYCRVHYNYEFYFDDHKSNKQVIDTKSGNCTDLLQMCCNMATAMGYEWKVIHTQCKQSGTGHVYGKFRHKVNTNNQWVTRDIACIVDENRSCVWCNVDTGAGYQLAINPSWFMSNLNR